MLDHKRLSIRETRLWISRIPLKDHLVLDGIWTHHRARLQCRESRSEVRTYGQFTSLRGSIFHLDSSMAVGLALALHCQRIYVGSDQIIECRRLERACDAVARGVYAQLYWRDAAEAGYDNLTMRLTRDRSVAVRSRRAKNSCVLKRRVGWSTVANFDAECRIVIASKLI